MPSDLLAPLKAQLNRLVAAIDLPEGVESDVLRRTVNNFTSAGPELLDEATPYLWAYYNDVANGLLGPEAGLPDLSPLADIWAEVSFTTPPEIRVGRGELEPAPAYLSFEGEVSWEREHGLQLVIEDGLRVCKVGQFDGHVTNAHAFGDSALQGVIYRA